MCKSLPVVTDWVVVTVAGVAALGVSDDNSDWPTVAKRTDKSLTVVKHI